MNKIKFIEFYTFKDKCYDIKIHFHTVVQNVVDTVLLSKKTDGLIKILYTLIYNRVVHKHPGVERVF